MLPKSLLPRDMVLRSSHLFSGNCSLASLERKACLWKLFLRLVRPNPPPPRAGAEESPSADEPKRPGASREGKRGKTGASVFSMMDGTRLHTPHGEKGSPSLSLSLSLFWLRELSTLEKSSSRAETAAQAVPLEKFVEEIPGAAAFFLAHVCAIPCERRVRRESTNFVEMRVFKSFPGFKRLPSAQALGSRGSSFRH